MKNRPKVGIAVAVTKGNYILLGKRLKPVGFNKYQLPGGHLEYGETFASCAEREVTEETGLIVGTPSFVNVQNNIWEDAEKHYVTIYMRAKWIRGEPINPEPHFCAGWEWFHFEMLPEPLFETDIETIDMLAAIIRRERADDFV